MLIQTPPLPVPLFRLIFGTRVYLLVWKGRVTLLTRCFPSFAASCYRRGQELCFHEESGHPFCLLLCWRCSWSFSTPLTACPYVTICPQRSALASGSYFQDIRAHFDWNNPVYGAVSLASATLSGPHEFHTSVFFFFLSRLQGCSFAVFKCTARKRFLNSLLVFL